jgi:methionine-rich copper-binding protein CopC
MRAIILVFSLLLATVPGGAFAHAMLDHAEPRVGSTATSAPKEVVLWFTQKLEPAFSSIEVRNDRGAAMQAGKATVIGGTQLRVPLKALSPGTYKVFWRVLSVDTHQTQGDFSFRVGP